MVLWLIVVSVAIVVVFCVVLAGSLVYIFLDIVIVVFVVGLSEFLCFFRLREIPHSEIPLESPCVGTWYKMSYVHYVPSLLQAIRSDSLSGILLT